MRSRFQAALVTAMGCDVKLLGTSGVTVAGHLDRAENHVTAGYFLDGHVFITCDPAVEQQLIAATAGMDPTLAAWVAVADALEGELLGTGIMQVLRSVGMAPTMDLGQGYELRSLDRVVDRALIKGFIEDNTEDDLDEAEIDLEDLDELIEAVLHPASGRIVSWAAARPFDMASDFGDIGVLTHPDHRAKGLGRSAVAAICTRMTAFELEPLYRCDSDNEGSVALSASLGFEVATELTAFRFDPNL